YGGDGAQLDAAAQQAGNQELHFTSITGAAVAQKPYPNDMDEWQQRCHDASCSLTSQDLCVGPPTMVRWINGASWGDLRMAGSISAGGRIFYKSDGVLYARNAFNGIDLWSRPTANAFPRGPTLIADGDRVYTQLPESKNLVALNAATGE